MYTIYKLYSLYYERFSLKEANRKTKSFLRDCRQFLSKGLKMRALLALVWEPTQLFLVGQL